MTTIAFVVTLPDHATDVEFERYLGWLAAHLAEVNMVGSLRNRTAEFAVTMDAGELLAAVQRAAQPS